MSILPQISRRTFLNTSIGAAASVGLYTWKWEPHWLEIVRRELLIENLPDALIGKTIAHLSDIHCGERVPDNYLRDVFARVSRLSPDFVIYTGDFISYHAGSVSQMPGVFKHLPRGNIASFGVLGNHDYGPGWSDPDTADWVCGVLNDFDIQILRNESVIVSAGLQVIGLDDLWAGRFDVQRGFSKIDSSTASIVLTHNPDALDRPGWENYSGWIFSGHTHGGQCKPPFLPAPLLPVENRRYSQGEVRVDQKRNVYISRGVGHLLQVRFNVRPEVTIFRMQRA